MRKVRVIVSCRQIVMRSGIAMVLNSAEGFEILGREGADIMEEAVEIQPDLIIYVLCSSDHSVNEVLSELKSLCSWTRIIVFTASPVSKESFKKILRVCDGYIQGPVLPGYLLKALELACYSNYFFFLGTGRVITPDVKEEIGLNIDTRISAEKVPGSQ